MEHFYHNIGEPWFNFQDIYSRMVNHFTDGSHFVEVGVWKGRSASYMAVEILNSGKNIRFDCVDTFEGSEENLDPASPYFNPKLLEEDNWLYNEFSKNILPVRDVITPIKKSSLEAAELYEDRSLDFVFIDAAHDYVNVKSDILAWYPKIKKGGFIGGHDYAGGPDPEEERDYTQPWGVRQAVDEIFSNIETSGSSWLYRKS